MNKIFSTCLFLLFTAAISAQNWTAMALGKIPVSYLIFSISAVGDNVIWAVASQEYYEAPIPNTHRPIILRSSDAGLTWVTHEVEEAAGTVSFQIVALDSLTAIITTQDYGGGGGRGLFRTSNGGINWNNILDNETGGVALTRFNDGVHWLAHNRQSIGKSANNGQTWQNSTITGYQADEYQLLTSGANMCATVGDTVWNGTSSGRIVRFTNYGAASQFMNTPLGTATTIYSVAFQSHLKGLCSSRSITNNNRIARSIDGGATWTTLPQQPGNATTWNMTAVPGSPGYYVLVSNYNFTGGRVAITKNFGDSWSVQDLSTSLNSVVFTSATSGWAGAGKISLVGQPALFKYSGAALVGLQGPTETLPGFSVSPNPVHETLYFELGTVDAKGQVVNVTLTDLAGHVVFQGAISDHQIDMSKLPVGVYFLKAETSTGWAVRKVVRD